MSTTNRPPQDQSLNNLVVSQHTTLNYAQINRLTVGTLNAAEIPLELVPSASFALSTNNSKVVGQVAQVSFQGVVTGDVGGTNVPIGSIDPAFAPSNGVFGAFCNMPAGIIVVRLDSNGMLETCVTGFPFPVGSYDINLCMTYLLK